MNEAISCIGWKIRKRDKVELWTTIFVSCRKLLRAVYLHVIDRRRTRQQPNALMTNGKSVSHHNSILTTESLQFIFDFIEQSNSLNQSITRDVYAPVPNIFHNNN